ncbi:hypothetical protein GQX73_g1801 [Xylaria multiplex]|uniref:GDS1 winged helix domain-containing protein n=1 Tax=Xylaria multiplex TaxID=323545 RepID=A0A7C8IT75_9PEZI|nr:hypothetical protein GQX73_g1801 [Xylaria multiplex]
MPYNTRRKSLSLPSLGIHVPVNRSSANNSNSNTHTNMATRRPSSEGSPRPSKKAKRSHNDSSSSTPTTTTGSKKYESIPTPKPSPGVHASIETDDVDFASALEVKPVDLDGINDDIVEAVIIRLQQTRNRPHLVKELATVLMDKLAIVQQSANPCAIISSRLATFLKRSGWTTSVPCPLAKELESIHPRRTYFYLTTCPHLPLPDPFSIQHNTIDTPSLSSSGSTTEDTENDRRRELSLSPEVDLSSPEFEDMEEDYPVPRTSIGSASGRHRPLHTLSRIHRAEEPPLEKDEKEFTQTADGLQRRRARGELLSATPVDQLGIDDGMQNEQLFGEPHRTFIPTFLPHMAFMTSPAMRPTLTIPAPIKRDGEAEGWSKLDALLDWDRSPETIELDELDCLLDEF